MESSKVSIPAENPNPIGCDYYLQHKRRFCKTEKRPGFKYCHTHQAELCPDTLAPSERRIPCPVNPKHSIYARDLKRHVTICPDLRHDATALPYYSCDIHALKGISYVGSAARSEAVLEPEGDAGLDDDDMMVPADISSTATSSSPQHRFTHRDLDEDALRVLTDKVMHLFNTHIGPHIKQSHGARVSSCGATRLSMKHSSQHAALASILAPCLEQTNGCSILMELGAGKGGLAFAISSDLSKFFNSPPSSSNMAESTGSNAVTTRPTIANPRIVVVDRGGFRRKKDGCVAQSERRFERLRINIKDLALDKVPSLLSVETPDATPSHPQETTPSTTTICAVGKHLCGACTDFALSCVSTHLPVKVTCTSILIATCCHHLCELRHVNPISRGADRDDASTGQASLQFHGTTITEKEFSAITSMTSWAVCGEHMVNEDRRKIGCACKRLIDAIRLEYLKEVCGFAHAELHEYVDATVTKENVCIVAWGRN